MDAEAFYEALNHYSGSAEATQAISEAYSTITADTSGASYAVYDRSAAVDYAHTYDLSSNPAYDLSRGVASVVNAVRGSGDCANFASQCLAAGGLPRNSDWNFTSGSYDILGRFNGSFTSAWATAGGLANYLESSPGLLNTAAGTPTQPGDLVGWSRDEGATVHHFGVVTSVDNGVVSYSAHTVSRHDQPITGLSGGDNALIFFHISSVYP